VRMCACIYGSVVKKSAIWVGWRDRVLSKLSSGFRVVVQWYQGGVTKALQ
jgi:hypothetical protein